MKFIITVCLLAVFTFANAQNKSPKKTVSKPNIIFILADDMGYSDMSWQGSPIQTPNLDKLKNGGMFLERSYVQPQCSPTRVALLTGNYPYRYGLHEHIVLFSSYTGIAGDTKTIAEKMKEGGYATAIVGKWHVGGTKQSYLPQNQGFDHSFVCINGAISYWNYTHDGSKHSDLIRNGKKVYAPSMLNSEASGNKYSTYMWADEAVEVINKHKKKKPLFMYLSFTAPHHPLNAPKALLDKYAQENIEAYWSGKDALKGRKAKTRQYYMAMVDAMDKAIGDVVEAVEKNGMKENTLIVFCSDNGGIIEADNRPFRSFKGDSFEGGVRVPSIVYWPEKVKAGSTSQSLVHISDWYPTFAELAGISVKEEKLDGISAVNIINGEKGKREVVPIISAGRHALINDKFALVGSTENYQRSLNNKLSEFQLYNISKDKTQQKPTEKFPAQQKEMQQQLMPYFSKVNRGYFNWDMKYAKYRKEAKKGDHNFDFVINDMPDLKISRSGKKAFITISPVSSKLRYTLQGSVDGMVWKDLDKYICKKDAEKYTFPAFPYDKKIKEYRVVSDNHFGLPLYDGFSLDNAYQSGAIYTQSDNANLKKFLPVMDGFLPVADVSGGKYIKITESSLAYKNFKQEGGALQLKSKSQVTPTYLTKYFIEPHSRGKVYASMLVHFDALEGESIGEINWLVQNGWNGTTEKQASLCFQNDGIYFKQADPILPESSVHWVAPHNNNVVLVIFEFELGTTGQDKLKVYINPDNMEQAKPTKTFTGEFTFDRLQFATTGRTGGVLTVDELHIGTSLESVLHQKIEVK